MCRLLIYSGFNPKQRDNFGQTPLHLGCLSGSLNTVQVLVEQDIELEAVDFNGNVPRKLAEGINLKLKSEPIEHKFLVKFYLSVELYFKN